MKLIWEDKKYSKEYKLYLKEVGNNLRNTKEKMLASGWIFSCIEPNYMSYDEFVKNNISE